MRPILLPRPTGTPSLAVWKFASCDGCQLTLLDCEAELLDLAERIDIASFPQASSATVAGPYDLSLVEGSVTTSHDAARIREIRASSRVLVTIGACATTGGIQALRNGADVGEFLAAVYPRPDDVATLATSTAIAEHVVVDFELRGCPIDVDELFEFLAAYLAGRPPRTSSASVCTQCKARGIPCVLVADGAACLGPVTHAGCGARCPAVRRGCYGCFGPSETTNTASLDRQLGETGLTSVERRRLWRGVSGWAPDGARAASDGGDPPRWEGGGRR